MPHLTVPEIPHLVPSAIEWLMQELPGVQRYLEFGAGGSTRLAASMGVPLIVSVESDPDFAQAVRDAVAGTPKSNVEVIHVDIGPIKAWGSPIDTSKKRTWWHYPTVGWDRFTGKSGPDLIVIDGRFRPACFLLSLLRAAPGTKILFDDYAERPAYKVVERFVEPTKMLGRSAVFFVPKQLDRPEVAKELEISYFKPA